jgi:hypothetical protein
VKEKKPELTDSEILKGINYKKTAFQRRIPYERHKEGT